MFKKTEIKIEREIVSCEDCKCLVYKDDAHFVIGIFEANSYYCQEHKKPYNKKFKNDDVAIYWGSVEMSEDGTPVGYKKIKVKN